MKFQVDVPDEVFWKIAGAAENHDMRVPDYAAELVIAAANAPQRRDHDPIVRMWREGLTDREIARRLNLTNIAVASHRQRFQLPANRRSRKDVA